MKKFLKLTTREAIQHFILKDDTLAPQTPDEIGQKFSELHRLQSPLSVTIVIPTHRTKPSYLSDNIVLKNKIDEAEKRLYATYDKREVWPIAESLQEAQETIDHSLNLDTLVVYANEHFSSVVKLPIESTEEVIIGKYFDFRPLYRTVQQSRRYYILCVSKHVIRLIEAFNDKAEREVEHSDFPFEKNAFYTKKWDKPVGDGFEDNMEKEFFNDADKSFQLIYNNDPLPVVLAGDVKTVAYFQEQMDESRMVIGRIPGSFDHTPLHVIVDSVYPEVEEIRRKTQESYLTRIDTAKSSDHLITDIQDIIDYSEQGRIETLFAAYDFTMTEKGGTATGDLSSEERAALKSKTDDLYFKILRDVSHNGGSVVMLDDNHLEEYGGIVGIARF